MNHSTLERLSSQNKKYFFIKPKIAKKGTICKPVSLKYSIPKIYLQFDIHFASSYKIPITSTENLISDIENMGK